MELSGTLLPTLVTYLIQLPLLLVWLIGIILAGVYWRRNPAVSLLTIIAIGMLFLESLVATYLNLWLPVTLSQRGWGASQMGTVLALKGLVQSIANAAAWGLLIAAIFGWRRAEGKN